MQIQISKPFPFLYVEAEPTALWKRTLSQFNPVQAISENQSYHPVFKKLMNQLEGIVRRKKQQLSFQLTMTSESTISGFQCPKKPDFTGFIPDTTQSAANIVFFIELKVIKTGSTWDSASVVQILGYCERALSVQPMRQFIYGALCNNKDFQLFRVQRNPRRLQDRRHDGSHWVNYEAYPTVPLMTDGFKQLYTLATASSAQLGIVPLPLVTVDGATLAVELDVAVGYGAHAVVYKAFRGDALFAVKVFLNASVCRTEVDVLQLFATNDVPNVPRVINSMIVAEAHSEGPPSPSWIVVQPLATHIDLLAFNDCHARDVINCLQAAHKTGYVCRDVRIANIMEHEGHAYIVDWNSAALIGIATMPSGTVRCAPDNVLVAMENNQSYEPAAKDDLISLVRLMLLRVRASCRAG